MGSVIEEVCTYMGEYITKNWGLLIFPLLLTALLLFIYKISKKMFKKIDEQLSELAKKVLIVFLMLIVSLFLFLLNSKNSLMVVLAMGLAGEIMNIILIPIATMLDLTDKEKNCKGIVKKEYRKYFRHQILICKNIWHERNVQIEKNDHKRKEEIIGCATISLLALAAYSFFIGEKALGYLLVSFVFGKFLWLEGGIPECFTRILYYIKKEIKIVVELAIVWILYHYFIDIKGCDMSALYWGIAPVFIIGIAILAKDYKKKKGMKGNLR